MRLNRDEKGLEKGPERFLTHGDLFSGIGGFALAALWNGVRTVWASDIDEFCNGIYRKRFPEVEVFGDVTKKKGFPKVDLITAGFPCQPVSVAGRRKGTEDERWLWPDTQRIICLVGPRWVLLENVPGLLNRGMSEVLGGLSEIGYYAEWQVIPAAAFGAPHLRERVWIVAYPRRARGGSREVFPKDFVSGGSGREGVAHSAGVEPRKPDRKRGGKDTGPRGGDGGRRSRPPREEEIVAYPKQDQLWIQPGRAESGGADPTKLGNDGPKESVADATGQGRESWRTAGKALLRPEAEQRFGRCCGSLGEHWTTEPDVGRVAHGIPARVDRLKALGNAIVPQVAAWIISLIVEADREVR